MRVAQSKILIETKNYEQALQVIKTCQQENDEDIETWYLYGWCYFLIVCGDDNEMNKDLEQCTDTQLDTLEDARDCFVYLLQVLTDFSLILIEYRYLKRVEKLIVD